MKKMCLMALLITLMTSLLMQKQALAASSGILLTLNAYYVSDKTERETGATTSTSESKTTIYDLKLGSVSSEGVYFGGIYTSRGYNANSLSITGSATGVSLGYVGNRGFYFMGHYIFSATDLERYSEGTGMQADVGYLMSTSGGFVVGAELTYRSISYKKDDSDTSLDHYKYDQVMPMLTLGFMF